MTVVIHYSKCIKYHHCYVCMPQSTWANDVHFVAFMCLINKYYNDCFIVFYFLLV